MEDTLTARQIRLFLFFLDNQHMSVEELRRYLFDLEQDQPLTDQALAAQVNREANRQPIQEL